LEDGNLYMPFSARKAALSRSDGFREWNETIGKGKPVLLASGARLKINVELEPKESTQLSKPSEESASPQLL
jgi:hypothetical protein